MSEDLKDKKNRVLVAAEKAVDELIKVLEMPILTSSEEEARKRNLKKRAAAKELIDENVEILFLYYKCFVENCHRDARQDVGNLGVL